MNFFNMGNHSSGGKQFGDEAKKIVMGQTKPEAAQSGERKAIFAGGCFWGVELSYQRVPGVLSTKVGYIGGQVDNPTYRQVCSGNTGHAEAVEVTYDPSQVSFDNLLTVFWDRHDPTTYNRQGNDVGSQYRSAIFYTTEEQREVAMKSKAQQQKHMDRDIVTEIVKADTFYPAEENHQQYLAKGGQCKRKGDTSGIRCYG